MICSLVDILAEVELKLVPQLTWLCNMYYSIVLVVGTSKIQVPSMSQACGLREVKRSVHFSSALASNRLFIVSLQSIEPDSIELSFLNQLAT